MTLRAKLRDIQEKIKDKRDFPNEASVSQGIVLPILRELNWDTDNTRVVRPEYSVTKGKGRADFVLCDDGGNPKVFIEVKKLGSGTEDAEGQAVDYARKTHAPAPIVVSTDGRTWSFCLLEQGGDGHQVKRVDEINVSDNTLQESSEVLQRYLEESRVVEGEALKTARVNFFLKKHLKGKPDGRPIVERTMVNTRINDFVVAIYELRYHAHSQFEEEIGPKSAEDNIDHDIADYFHSLLREKFSQSPIVTTGPQMQPESGRQVSAPAKPELMTMTSAVTQPESEGQVSVLPEQAPKAAPVRIKEIVICRQHYPCTNQKEAMVILFKKLQEENPDFLQLFYKHSDNQRGGRPRYLGRNRLESLGMWSPMPISGGWFISTGYGWEKKKDIIDLAARVAGLKLKFEEDISGKGIIVNLDKKT